MTNKDQTHVTGEEMLNLLEVHFKHDEFFLEENLYNDVNWSIDIDPLDRKALDHYKDPGTWSSRAKRWDEEYAKPKFNEFNSFLKRRFPNIQFFIEVDEYGFVEVAV